MNKKQTLKRVATVVIAANVLASTFITTLPAKSFAAETDASTQAGTKAETKLLGAGLQATSGNLLVNSQFNGLSGWDLGPNFDGVNVACSANYDGSVTMYTTTNQNQLAYLSQTIPTVKGHVYRVTATLTNTNNAQYALFFGPDIQATVGTRAGNFWFRINGTQTATFYVTAEASATTLMMNMSSMSEDPGKFKYSNLSVVDTSAVNTTLNPLTTNSTTATGQGQPGGTVVIKNGGTTIGTGTVNSSGNYSITIPKQPANSTVTANVTAPGVNSSASQVVTQDAIMTPTINAITTKSTTASGTGEPGSTLTFTANSIDYTATVAANGTWSVTIPRQAANTTVTAKSVLNGVTSGTATATVTHDGPSTPILNNVTNKSTKVTGTGDPGNTIIIKVKTGDDSISYTGTIDAFGEFSVNIDTPEAGATVDAIAKDSSGDLSDKASKIVLDVIAPDAPAVNAVTDEDVKVTGKGEANCDVTVTLPSGGTVTGRTDADGNFNIAIPKQTVGKEIKVNLTDAAGNVGQPTTVIVQADALANPTVNRISNQDTKATGTGIAGATVTLTANGVDYTAVVGTDGNYEVTIPKLAADLSVAVKQAKSGKSSGTVTTIVQDDSVPAKPTVNPVKEGDTTITGKGVPDNTITITLPDDTTATGKVDGDGNFSIVVPAQEEGAIIDVTQTGKNNLPSDPTTITVTSNEKPVITATDKTLTVGDTFVALTGVTATDKEDGNLTSKITVTSNTVDTTKAGTYAVTYSVTDSDNNTTTKTITVTVAVAKTIKINENITTASTGTTQQFTATTTPAGETVTWSTSNSTFATVNKTTGLVTFKAPGIVTITAALADGTKATRKITITDAKVEAPVVSTDIYDTTTSASGTAPAGTVTAYVNGLPIGTTTVDADGKFKVDFPVQTADAVIAFVAANDKGTTSTPTNVTVKKATIKINEDITTATTGTTQQFTATTTPADAVVSWSTSNSNYATVNKTTGLVTFKAPGIVTITATLASGTKATTKITIANKVVAAPVVPADIYDVTTSANGTATAGNKVTAYVNGIAIGTTTAAADGTFKVDFAKQAKDTTINFVAEDAQGTASLPTAKVVKATTLAITGDATGLVGDTATLTATSNPAGQPATSWTSSNEAIATVSATGVVTYKGPGTVVITAKTATGATATKSIVVTDLPQPVLSPVTILDSVVNGTIDTTNYDVKQVLILINGVNKNTVSVTDGKFTANIGKQPAGTIVEARYKDQAGNYLTADQYVGKTTVVSLTKDITVNDVTSLQKVVTGKTIKPNASIRLYVDGVQKRTTTSDADGNYSFNSGYLKVGQVVKVELREGSVVIGTDETIVIQDTASMVLDQVTTSDRYITGKGDPNTSFRLSINGVTKTVKTSDADGLFSFGTSALPVGTVVKVEMKSAGTYSVSEETIVVQGEVKESDLTLDESDIGETTVTGTTKQPFTQVRLSLNGATKSTATSGEDGSYSFTTPVLKSGDVVKVEMKVDGVYAVSKEFTVDASSGGSGATNTITVADLTASSTTVTGKTNPNAQVRISLNDVTKSTVTADADGNYSYAIGTLAKDDVVKVELSVAGTYSVSATTTVKAADVAGGNLVLNPVVAADRKVTGTTDANAQVRISLNGATKSIVTAAADGTFTYNMSTLKAGDVIKGEIKVNGVWAVSKEVTVQ